MSLKFLRESVQQILDPIFDDGGLSVEQSKEAVEDDGSAVEQENGSAEKYKFAIKREKIDDDVDSLPVRHRNEGRRK